MFIDANSGVGKVKGNTLDRISKKNTWIQKQHKYTALMPEYIKEKCQCSIAQIDQIE